VQEVTLDAKTAGVDYMLDASTGAITELVEFGTGVAVVVSYTTPFVLPPTYPAPPNDSPDLGQSSGEWSGLSMVDGTYAVSLVARKALTWVFLTEPTPYEAVSPVAAADFLVGGATVHEPYALIDSGDSCHACHQDVTYHPGGYRGFETCIACHGSAGAEDRPQYVSAGAPATPGRSVSFRELLHGIHMGSRLAQPQAFQVVGEGPGAYPDDYVVRTYEQVLFPVMPRAAASCITCHGEANQAWLDPTDRSHPTEQTVPLATWAGACAICHDDVLAVAHMVANTAPSGAESCVICHGPGESEAVDVVHPQGQGSSHQHP
jgi:OmcA/MtrC family decaheme c-type cytochrome